MKKGILESGCPHVFGHLFLPLLICVHLWFHFSFPQNLTSAPAVREFQVPSRTSRWLASLSRSATSLSGSLAAPFTFFRRQAESPLNWPTDLGYLGMKRRVSRHFRRRGWKLRSKHSVEFDFIVSHNAGEFVVRCYPAGQPLFRNIIVDFSMIPGKYPDYRNKGLLLVTADDIEDTIIADGLDRNVHVFHYKQLNRLTGLDPATPNAVRDLVSNILSERVTQASSLRRLQV
jgi:hypothetical protein